MRSGDEDRNNGSHSELSGSSRDVVQAGNVRGGVHFHAHEQRGAGEFGPPRPQQLPRDVRGFVNRSQELDGLNAILASAEADHHAVSLCVIAGTAGAGKTALALHWAHLVQDRFADGQLYVNLRGYDPGEPVAAGDALNRFIIALGVPVQAIPQDTEAAAALYRSLLAERSMLILLDNAAAVTQVRPLLPGNSDCLVIVTSRGRMSGLAVHDGAHRLTLGVLPEAEAVALLRAVIAGYRPEDDADALAELARLCARLPLALCIAAERAVTRPHMRLAELISDLKDESALWEALSTDDEEADAVRSVFAWSYRALQPAAARLFRLLGLHPGPEFGIGAAAALAGTSVRRVRQLLDVLVGAFVLEQTAPDRYEFHDLLRVFAAEQAQHEESAGQRDLATRRMLDWYLHTADSAQSWIEPAEDHLPLDVPAEAAAPLSFPDYDRAVDWAEQEHANFLPAVRAAEQAGFERHAWLLAAVLWNAQAPSAVVTDWLEMGRIGLRVARRIGDRAAEAKLLENLGFGHVQIHRTTEGLDYQYGALEIWQELGERSGQAAALNAIGLIHLRVRRLHDAEVCFAQAITAFGELGERHWEAVSVANLAEARHQAGRLQEAEDSIRRAMAAHRELGSKRSLGNALRIVSGVHLDRGEPDKAAKAANDALEIAADLRDHVLEGHWLLAFGDTQQALGHFDEALIAYQRSATLQRRQGDRSREARAWQGAGEAYGRLGRLSEAADFHRRAAAVQQELGHAWYEAMALDGLATVVRDDRPDEARRLWSEALRLLADYGDSRAEQVRERISGQLA
ncbi:NB-ARC domain-containing protein [Murinocardiopsis flavida]|uniref:NB-ARC domain-containing protein n=1 Tax=Murinocardiopsis flavida TaxID=645275 RepID=A0A2P8CXE0_9ACTN|nr:NB-ARC domain-containing protein [Murinocardiopsis flavida]